MIDTRKANCHYLVLLFHMLATEEAMNGDLGLDANDEACMKRAFTSYIVPWVKELPADSQEALRNTLAYFLKREVFPEITYLVHGLALNEPDDERRLFQWLWDVLYPDARVEDIVTNGMTEDNDMMGINRFQGLDLPDSYFNLEE